MLRRLRLRLRALTDRRGGADREMRQELQAHIEHRSDDLIRSGLGPAEARRQARVEFGGVEGYMEQLRDERIPRIGRPLAGLWLDLRMAGRRLRAAPAFTLFAVVTLSAGIGVTTMAYSLIDYGISPTTALRESDRLVEVGEVRSGRVYPKVFDIGGLNALRQQQTTLSDVMTTFEFSSALHANRRPELVLGEAVSGNLFEVLGVRAELGRLIQPDDDRADAPAVIVLSHLRWRSQFDGAPDVVGKIVSMAGRSFEVIGVAPPTFRGVANLGLPPKAVWVPLSAVPSPGGESGLRPNGTRPFLEVKGRLAPGIDLETASAEFEVLGARLGQAMAQGAPRTLRLTRLGGISGRTPAGARFYMIYMIYLALPVLVLLVACTNLTNLVLSRGSSRRHEIAVRSALGGSRWRIVREQLTEGMLLGAAGGLGALLVTRAALVYLSQMIPATFGDQPNFQLGADLRPGAFAVAGLAGLLSLGLASLVPALRLSRANARSSLSSAAQQAAPRWRGRSFLIAVQVSVSVGLFLLTSFGFTALAHEGRGLLREGLDRVGQVDVPFSRQQIDEGRVQEIIDRVLRELATHPGIESVAATAMDPEQWARPTARVTSRERPMGDGIDDYRGEYAELAVSTPGVFDALSLRIASGRPFDERDAAGAPPVAVITESLAVQIFGTADAVGRQMLAAMQRLTAGFVETMPTQDLEIIGVAVDTPNGNGRAEHVLFVPLARQSGVDLALVARAAPEGDAAGAATLLATTLRRVAPDVAMSFAGPLTLGREWLGFAILRQATRVAGVLASIALVLSMTGLYGVLSHVVARRRREIGVRVALGASPREVAGLVLRQGARPVVLGLGIGLVAAALLRLGLQPLFKYDVTAVDPVAFVFAAGPLLAAAVVACYLPARRAARVDPNVALRDL